MITIERTMTAAPLKDVEQLQVLLFEGELNAHQFQISPPERISFSGMDVTARFIRPDQTDVAITGWLDERGRANVVLTQRCYQAAGNFKLYIYVVNEEKTVCVYACTGSVIPTVGLNGQAPTAPDYIETYDDGALDALEDRIAAVETGDAFMPALVPYKEAAMTATRDYAIGDIIAVGMLLFRVQKVIESGDTLTTSQTIGSITIQGNVDEITLREYLSGTGLASKPGAHAEGTGTTASGNASHAEGNGTAASSASAHAEGINTTASGSSAHSEGSGTTASGSWAHAEGVNTVASGNGGHAEGIGTTASGTNSHAEGAETVASGDRSHAEGRATEAGGVASHAEGYDTTASGNQSHAEGKGTIAKHLSQHVFGEYNVEDPDAHDARFRGTYVEIVGNGTGLSARSNARTLDWSGNESLAGGLTLGAGSALESFLSPLQLKTLLIRAASGRCHVVRGTGYGGVLVPAPVLTPDGVIFGDSESSDGNASAPAYFFVDDYGCVVGSLPYNTGLVRFDKDLTNPPAIFPRSGYVHMDYMMFWDAENQEVVYKLNQNEQEPVMNLYLFGSWTWNAGTGRLFDCDYNIILE